MNVLAINGGAPIRTQAFAAWPPTDDKQREWLLQAYNSGDWGIGGEFVHELEVQFNRAVGTDYGTPVSSGTVALEIALRALEIGPGDEVIVPDYTFFSTASSVSMVGATPVFCDVEVDTFNIDAADIERCITPQTKAIIAVHVGGLACDMDAVCTLARKHGLSVVEDCAHAFGALYEDRALGTLGDIGAFSFQSSKLITCGEGGYICTKHKELYRRIWSIVHCGRDLERMSWYQHTIIGTNARMTQLQAAIVLPQLEAYQGLRKKMVQNALVLDRYLENSRWLHARKRNKCRTNYYIYGCIYVGMEAYGIRRKLFVRSLRAEGIPVSEGYKALHQQECFRGLMPKEGDAAMLRNTLSLAQKKAIWFEHILFANTPNDVRDVVAALEKLEYNISELQQYNCAKTMSDNR